MKKLLEMFQTADGVRLADVIPPVFTTKDDRVHKCEEIGFRLMEASGESRDRRPEATVKVWACANTYTRVDAETFASAEVVKPIDNLYSTQAAANVALAETHMNKALAFSREAGKVGAS